LSGSQTSAGDRATLTSPLTVIDTDINLEFTLIFYYHPDSPRPTSADSMTTLEVARFVIDFISLISRRQQWQRQL